MVIPNGTILQIESRDGTTKPWMIWWLEEIESSGYNKYVVLKMTHMLTWRDSDGEVHEQWAYLSGPGTTMIYDVVKSSSGEALYKQNDNLHMFITPYNPEIKIDAYFEVPYEESLTAYKVARADVNSTPGVAYVTVDPTYVRDKTADNGENAVSASDYWFSGGDK